MSVLWFMCVNIFYPWITGGFASLRPSTALGVSIPLNCMLIWWGISHLHCIAIHQVKFAKYQLVIHRRSEEHMAIPFSQPFYYFLHQLMQGIVVGGWTHYSHRGVCITILTSVLSPFCAFHVRDVLLGCLGNCSERLQYLLCKEFCDWVPPDITFCSVEVFDPVPFLLEKTKNPFLNL